MLHTISAPRPAARDAKDSAKKNRNRLIDDCHKLVINILPKKKNILLAKCRPFRLTPWQELHARVSDLFLFELQTEMSSVLFLSSQLLRARRSWSSVLFGISWHDAMRTCQNRETTVEIQPQGLIWSNHLLFSFLFSRLKQHARSHNYAPAWYLIASEGSTVTRGITHAAFWKHVWPAGCLHLRLQSSLRFRHALNIIEH